MNRVAVVAPLGIEGLAVRGLGRPIRVGMRARWAQCVPADAGAVVVAGFCGALDPGLRPGDLIVATEIRESDRAWECPSAPLLASALRRAGLRATEGPIVTVASIVRGPQREQQRATGAIAADMESAILAGIAGDRPLAVVRAVVDTPRRELSNPVATVTGGVRAFRALRRAVPVLRDWAAALGPRRVLLAGPRSFCAGVERAIEIVERALDRFGPPVYVRKQIVHNLHVVRDLERHGAVFVDSLAEIPTGATAVFSAHGVSPQVRAEASERRLRVIDATCPLVTKVHAEATRFASEGRTIFLIGHDGHEEVEGTTGEAPAAIRLVERAEDLDRIDIDDPARVAYLTQTTLAVDEVADIVAAIRRRFPHLAGPGSADICYATQNRQDAVKAVARECGLLLVIGSENSSNSKRLAEVAEREGCPAHLVEDETEIDLRWLAGARTIGVTAGASAPEALVERVVTSLAGLGPVEVEDRTVVTESMQFTLPAELR